jgi:PIN domain nuclease of toxin-antitoxin system
MKAPIGRLPIPGTIQDFLTRMAKTSLVALPVQREHVFALSNIPLHRDSFDRMLVAQSIAERMPPLTNDAMIGRYQLEVIW